MTGGGSLHTLTLIAAAIGGLFGFATIHYAMQWWLSRHERVLLAFAIQCAMYATFSLFAIKGFLATDLFEALRWFGPMFSIGAISHATLVHLYAIVGNRRDLAFRWIASLVMIALVVYQQWTPLRGHLVAVQPMPMPGGMGLRPVYSGPSALLPFLYIVIAAIQSYGVFVGVRLWKRDRWGALLFLIGVLVAFVTVVVGVLIDYAHVRIPYVGASPYAVFVVCMALMLSREYSARGRRVTTSERQFAAAFQHTPIGKALLAPDGRFLQVNAALCQIIGATSDELCAKHLRDLVTYEADADYKRMLAGEIASCSFEQQTARTDGEERWVELVLSVVVDDRGQPAHLIASVQDVTELRARREELEELITVRTQELSEAKDEAVRANGAKGEFLAHMSHEIRNVLGVIRVYTQLLQQDVATTDEQRKKLDIIHSSGKHLLAIMEEVLELSRLNASQPELAATGFDPRATIDAVVQMFAAQAASKGIELVSESSGVPRMLRGDGGKVKQVLINLTGNALKFTTQGSIRLEASSSELADRRCLITIKVTDTGAGISSDHLELIFQPFEQSGARAEGAGLGLAISQSYARLMGGNITADSTVGEGTAFVFTFVAERIAIDLLARCKVLVVDDEEANRVAIAELLAEQKCETRTAATGRAALAVHVDWYPDLVLVDLSMPEMDGFETIRRLKAAGSTASIGVVSATKRAEDEQAALAVGADFFIRKPFDTHLLLDHIWRALSNRSTTQRR